RQERVWSSDSLPNPPLTFSRIRGVEIPPSTPPNWRDRGKEGRRKTESRHLSRQHGEMRRATTPGQRNRDRNRDSWGSPWSSWPRSPVSTKGTPATGCPGWREKVDGLKRLLPRWRQRNTQGLPAYHLWARRHRVHYVRNPPVRSG